MEPKGVLVTVTKKDGSLKKSNGWFEGDLLDFSDGVPIHSTSREKALAQGVGEVSLEMITESGARVLDIASNQEVTLEYGIPQSFSSPEGNVEIVVERLA